MFRVLSVSLIVACLASPVAASAGVLTWEPVCGGSSGCSTGSVTYRAVGDPSSRITARTLAGKGLLLTDTKARIKLTGAADGECTAHRQHTVTCKRANEVRIVGGNRGDVIDGRGLSVSAFLEGGAGNDLILAPTKTPSQVSGGGGHNVLVGSRETTVSYANAEGPVGVDLGRGVGVAPGERDRLIRVHDILGSAEYPNRIVGGAKDKVSLAGGEAWNYFRVQAPSIVSVGGGHHHQPSAVLCEHGVTIVDGVEARDMLSGTCKVGQVQLLGSLNTASSAFLSVERQSAFEYENVRVARLTVVALPSQASVGEVIEPASGASPTVTCRLNATGQALLRRLKHLHVRVTEFDAVRPLGGLRGAPFVVDTFSSTLELAHR
jgi:hypothetical protein